MKSNRLLSAALLWLLFFIPLLPARSGPPDCTLPASASLEASALGATWVSLSWAEVSGAYGYRVRIYALPAGDLVSDLLSFDLSATIGSLSAGGAYRCAVTTLCQSGTAAIHDNTIVIDIVLNNSSPGDESPTVASGTPDGTALPAAVLQNPFTEFLRLSVPVPAPTLVRISLLSLDGRLVQEHELTASPGSSLEVSVGSLEKGWYWVRIETEYGIQTLRAVKM